MTRSRPVHRDAPTLSLPKARTGVQGLDEITSGGLPRGRPTLICGAAGCGKTLLATEILARGAMEFGEPGVFLAFEETAEELGRNVASLGFDLATLVRRKKLVVDYIHVERSEIEETGEYDLDGLFIRLGHSIDSIGAKRVALDTLEVLFGGLSNAGLLRAELKRLFRWLKSRNLTTVVTAERGDGALTRHGIEEYVSDCVLLLDHRVNGQISTRRMRVVKYRGSSHGTNEFPFLIDQHGISVLPITSVNLDHDASAERISTGIPRLDAMLGGAGLYRGSSVLLSGTAGTGKTSISCHLADASCRRGERCLYFAFEESKSQIVRNMRSIGLDLEPWVKKGLLRFHSARPTSQGLEMHLVAMYRMVEDFRPDFVVIDPISSFITMGQDSEVNSMLIRLMDHLKSRRITNAMVNLTHGGEHEERTVVSISSMIDTWLLLRDIESNGERNRGIYVLKSRGMAHSNQIRELLITSQGISLADVYLGPEGMLTGSARLAQETRERLAASGRQSELGRKRRDLERKRKSIQAQIAALRHAYETEREEIERGIADDVSREQTFSRNEAAMAVSRKADVNGNRASKRGRR